MPHHWIVRRPQGRSARCAQEIVRQGTAPPKGGAAATSKTTSRVRAVRREETEGRVAAQALFSGLVSDESGMPVDVAYVGGEAFYVVDDDGFKRHVPSENVDRQVLESMRDMIQGHEEMISEGTMKMLGQEDVFTKAMIDRSLDRIDEHIDALLQTGIPPEAQAWLGMVGFRVTIDVHGDVVKIDQPSEPEDPE